MKRLFITGMARSGTSWLLKCFGCHPEVLCLYEPFNLANARQKLPPELRFWQLLPRLRELVAKGNFEQAVREFARPLDRFDLIRDRSLDRAPFFPQPADPRMAALKEDFSGLLPVVGEYGKVLFIARDPRAILNSLWNHTHFGRNYGLRSTVERWGRNIAEAMDLTEKDPKNYQIVRYEDLVKEPVGTADKLHAWAGLAPLHPDVKSFMLESVSRHDPDPYQVFKDPERVEAVWKQELSAATQELVLKIAAETKAIELYPELKT